LNYVADATEAETSCIQVSVKIAEWPSLQHYTHAHTHQHWTVFSYVLCMLYFINI